MASTEPDFTDDANSDAGRGINPVANGVDFLERSIELLFDSNDQRSLKYAVLHLQAAIEILVKVRLQREGFEHVFTDPYRANDRKWRQGDFRSVSLDDALVRLEKVAGVTLTKEDVAALKELTKERNKLQHFGSTSQHEVIDSKAKNALDVLDRFIAEHMLPEAPADEADNLQRAQDLIRPAMLKIDVLFAARWERITPELDAWTGVTIQCPECRQMAWTVDPEADETSCLFCRTRWSFLGEQSPLDQYVEKVLNKSYYAYIKGDGEWSARLCPECDEDAFVAVETRDAYRESDTKLCFACGLLSTAPTGDCARCGRETLDPEAGLCNDCWLDVSRES